MSAPVNGGGATSDVAAIERAVTKLRKQRDYAGIIRFVEDNKIDPLISRDTALCFIAAKNVTGFRRLEYVALYKRLFRTFPTSVFFESFMAQDKVALTELDVSRPTGFLHFPTTGGTSIRKYVTSSAPSAPYIHFGHRVVLDAEDCIEGRDFQGGIPNGRIVPLNRKALAPCFVFSAVRNIFTYFHSQSQIAGIDLDRLVKTAVEAESGLLTRRMIFSFPFAQPSGDLVVDWIIRTEHLAEDLAALSSAVPLNVALGPAQNARGKGDYRKAFTPELVDLVTRHWSDDIALYGFDFENGYADDAILRGDVRPLRDRVSYRWRDNTLTVC